MTDSSTESKTSPGKAEKFERHPRLFNHKGWTCKAVVQRIKAYKETEARHALQKIRRSVLEPWTSKVYNLDAVVDSLGNTALTLAIGNSLQLVALDLIKAGCTVNCKCPKVSYGEPREYRAVPVLTAAIIGRQDMVTPVLIRHEGCDLNALDGDGLTALSRAMQLNRPEEALKLIHEAPRCNLNLKDSDQVAPLIWAIGKKREDLAIALIENDCDLKAMGKDGHNALVWAIAAEFPRVAMKLMNAGCDWTTHSKATQNGIGGAKIDSPLYGRHTITATTPLEQAIAKQYTDVALELIRRAKLTKNIDYLNHNRGRALKLAAGHLLEEQPKIANKLVEAGAFIYDNTLDWLEKKRGRKVALEIFAQAPAFDRALLDTIRPRLENLIEEPKPELAEITKKLIAKFMQSFEFSAQKREIPLQGSKYPYLGDFLALQVAAQKGASEFADQQTFHYIKTVGTKLKRKEEKQAGVIKEQEEISNEMRQQLQRLRKATKKKLRFAEQDKREQSAANKTSENSRAAVPEFDAFQAVGRVGKSVERERARTLMKHIPPLLERLATQRGSLVGQEGKVPALEVLRRDLEKESKRRNKTKSRQRGIDELLKRKVPRTEPDTAKIERLVRLKDMKPSISNLDFLSPCIAKETSPAEALTTFTNLRKFQKHVATYLLAPLKSAFESFEGDLTTVELTARTACALTAELLFPDPSAELLHRIKTALDSTKKLPYEFCEVKSRGSQKDEEVQPGSKTRGSQSDVDAQPGAVKPRGYIKLGPPKTADRIKAKAEEFFTEFQEDQASDLIKKVAKKARSIRRENEEEVPGAADFEAADFELAVLDVLRVSVTVPDAAGVVTAIETLSDKFRVVGRENMFHHEWSPKPRPMQISGADEIDNKEEVPEASLTFEDGDGDFEAEAAPTAGRTVQGEQGEPGEPGTGTRAEGEKPISSPGNVDYFTLAPLQQDKHCSIMRPPCSHRDFCWGPVYGAVNLNLAVTFSGDCWAKDEDEKEEVRGCWSSCFWLPVDGGKPARLGKQKDGTVTLLCEVQVNIPIWVELQKLSGIQKRVMRARNVSDLKKEFSKYCESPPPVPALPPPMPRSLSATPTRVHLAPTIGNPNPLSTAARGQSQSCHEEKESCLGTVKKIP